ncbi:MAG: hypothetical protein LBT16_10735 [Treponema sp.]|jgi:hypothetical protein|nr:hypothetical protein [Treponema sp.]
MKLKAVKIGIALLGAIVILGIAGCEGEETSFSSIADLSKVTINGVEASLGTPSESWNAAGGGEVGLSYGQLSSALVTATPKGEGAVIYYALETIPGDIPTFVRDKSFNFRFGDSLYVESFSANQDKFLIYKINVQPKLLSSVNIAGKEPEDIISGISFAETVTVPVWYTDLNALKTVTVTAATTDSGAKVKYSTSPTESGTIPDPGNPYGSLNAIEEHTNGDPVPASSWVSIEVTVGPEAEPIVKIYKFRLLWEALSGAKIAGVDAVLGEPAPTFDVAAQLNPGSITLTAAQASAENPAISAALAAGAVGAKIEYGVGYITESSPGYPTYNAPTIWNETGEGLFVGKAADPGIPPYVPPSDAIPPGVVDTSIVAIRVTSGETVVYYVVTALITE